MPKKYTCPLCLDLLTRGHAIKVFKIADANSGAKSKHLTKRFDCGRKDFIEEIFKFSGEDVFIPIEEQAVYVSHDSCKAINPFWVKANNQIEIPGTYNDGDKFIADLQCKTTLKNFQKVMYYWMVKILRETNELGNDYPSMWYPLQLLLATAVKEGDALGRPYGSLVEMASTKSAGKTILTLQILNQALYRNGMELTAKEFFYPNPDSHDTDLISFKEKFYSEVFFHSMWRETPVSRPFGTEPSPGDLRAVFVQPVTHDEESDGVSVTRHSNGRVRGMAKGVASLAWFTLKETLFLNSKKKKKKDKAPALDLEQIFEERKDEFWNPIIFYDTAGELQQGGSPVTRAVRQLTNKLAICIDAREIFDSYDPLWPSDTVTPISERNASIKHAYKRLSEIAMAPRRKKATCIVVTKLDLVLSEEEKERIKTIAENPDGDEAARELLMKWLSDYSDHDKHNLRSFLSKSRKLVDRVFLIWTENLPRMRGVRLSPIKKVEPLSAKPGDEVTIEANDDFNFEDAKKVTINGKECVFHIVSKTQIKAVVPSGASSGLVGILLEGQRSGMGTGIMAQASTTYIDDATSDMPLTVKPERGNDAAKPRSYGLIKFLAWCLDKPVGAIARPTDH